MKKPVIDENTVLSRIIEVVATDMDGETVMISIENGKYYGIDVIGSRIWEILETPKTIAEVVRILMEEYEVEQEECQADVLELLNYLYDEKLVKFD